MSIDLDTYPSNGIKVFYAELVELKFGKYFI